MRPVWVFLSTVILPLIFPAAGMAMLRSAYTALFGSGLLPMKPRAYAQHLTVTYLPCCKLVMYGDTSTAYFHSVERTSSQPYMTFSLPFCCLMATLTMVS